MLENKPTKEYLQELMEMEKALELPRKLKREKKFAKGTIFSKAKRLFPKKKDRT